MNNTLGDALQKALDAKKNDYSNFVWKGEKRKEGEKYVQESEKIIDMSPERLKECWNHCEKMLRNDDPKHLGRYNVLEEVTGQISKCNTELLLRYFENTYRKRENVKSTERFSLMISLRQLMNNNLEISDWSIVPISHISDNLPDEFKDVSIADVLDGCTDNLGVFSKQHLTMTFITKMGLWFTKAEENELKGATNSNTERLKIAKEKLHLPSKLILRFSEKGLSYHEMRAMLTLPKKQKYSDMTTEQLVTLRNKILLRLSREIDGHIYSWRRLQKQIEIVAKSKNIDLND
jgi:hypothetical protein